MLIRNVSPYGDRDVPLLYRMVAGGETAEVTEDQARRLLGQVENWAPADDAAQAIADELAAEQADLERDALGMPAADAVKADWVAFARQQGDPDPESKTKVQLIKLYGQNGQTGEQS